MIMKHMGVQSAILSVTAPGPCILPAHSGQAVLARRLNEYAAKLRDEDHSAFGFFASLPDITNTTLALAELSHALDVLKADGVTLFTRYGPNATYLGHPSIEPIWKELDRRQATVFVHPTHSVDTAKVNEYLPQPFIDYPHETTRAAVDMITQRTLKKFPNVKVILSHAGGTLPYLAGRFLTPLKKVNNVVAGYMVGTGYNDALEAITKGFYYDVALSTEHRVLQLLMDMGAGERIVYGVSVSPNLFHLKLVNESICDMHDESLLICEKKERLSIRTTASLSSLPRGAGDLFVFVARRTK